MLKPNKYTSVPSSVLGVSAEILAQLKIDPTQDFSQLENKVIRRLGDDSKANYAHALVFLYSTDKIRYYHKQDVIELMTENKK